MKRLLGLIIAVMLCGMTYAQEFMMFYPGFGETKNDSTDARVLTVTTSVADHISHEAITKPKCELLAAADSSHVDTVSVQSWEEGDYKACWISFKIKEPGNYLLKVEADGYTTKYVPVDIKKIYKRELVQELKTIYLKKLPKKNDIVLDDVVVTATKLKFYMNGDTLVYDADAFNLADGSMLDGLIKKLPGVQMEKGGVIKVNGRKIDALLLNGKDFFNSDRELMLENMPAYMVKNVQAYDRTPRDVAGTAREKNTEKEFVMNVKLKKEYQSGWLANANLGGGLPMRDATGDASEKRYLARAFAMRFSDVSRLMLYANANNLNDNRQPGEDNSWTPSQQARGLQTNVMAGANYNYMKGEQFNYDASINTNYSQTDNTQYTNSGSYIGDSKTFSKSTNTSRSYDFNIGTNHGISYWGRSSTIGKYFKSVTVEFAPDFNYRRFNRNSFDASVQLSDDVASQLGKAWLDSIRTPQSSELLKQYAINRSLNSAKGDGHSTDAGVNLRAGFSPAHNDFLHFQFDAGYNFSDSKDRDYSHRTITYPHGEATLTPEQLTEQMMEPQMLNRFNDNFSRNSNFNFGTTFQASLDSKMRNTISLGYSYKNSNEKSNRSLYELNKLEGWEDLDNHPLGNLPSVEALMQTLDRGNSSFSKMIHNTHTFTTSYNYMVMNDSTSTMFYFNTGVNMPLDREHLTHQQRGVNADTVRTTFLPSPYINIHWNNHRKMTGVGLSYYIGRTAPSLTTLLDITNDADPLHKSYGNKDLRNTTTHTINMWGNAKWHKLMYNGGINAGFTQNAMAMSMIFDQEKGKSTTKPVNIDGNWRIGANAGFEMPVGKFTFRDDMNYNYNHSVDLSGTDEHLGAIRSIVHNNSLGENLTIQYEPTDKMEFALDGRMTYQNQRSKREGFQPVNAFDFNYGARATVDLPLNIQVSTDLTMYSRRGYADNTMNTNELVWNARVSKKFMHGNLTVQLDGFDILGNLSNVYRNVNAQGYTETFYNVIPSYCLLHIGWKLNKKPKKQAEDITM